MISIETLHTWACECGFSDIRLCAPDGFEHAKEIVDHQPTLSERHQLRFFPKEDHSWIQSLAVLLWPYLPPTDTGAENNLFVDSYYEASNAAYHAARELETRLIQAGHLAKANVSYPAKETALRAGLGVIGKNSLLITPEYGSRVVIILMATDLPVPIYQKQHASQTSCASCLDCGRCAKACPAGAIDERGMSHPEKCLRNFMLEGVVIPEHLRKKIGMRMIGCDICQRVCPMQPQFSRHLAKSPYLLRHFITEDAAQFSSSVSNLADEIGRNAARPQRIRAQAALLAGNSGNPAYLPVLRLWSDSSFEAVREHALWAISQIELADSDT